MESMENRENMENNMDEIEDQDTPRGITSVLNWYDRTRPMFIDLVGDYAGRDLFLVEGDSLLRECFEDERIDFLGNFPRLLHHQQLPRLADPSFAGSSLGG